MDTRHSRGFSLIELLVVVSIFSFIAAIGIASYNKGSSQTLLTSLAYDIALSLRQAQAFGLSSHEESAGSGFFDFGYGIHFDKDSPGSYIFFVDAVNTGMSLGVYNGGSSCSQGSECIDRFILSSGYRISNICVVASTGIEECSKDSDLSSVDIVFLRPDPDVIIHKDGSNSISYGGVDITVSSVGGQLERHIIVSSAGQISVTP